MFQRVERVDKWGGCGGCGERVAACPCSALTHTRTHTHTLPPFLADTEGSVVAERAAEVASGLARHLGRLAARGDARYARFPRAVPRGRDFSFSGLKTALLYDLRCAGSQAYLKLASEVIQREGRWRPV